MSSTHGACPGVVAVGRTLDVAAPLPADVLAALPGPAVALRWYSRVDRTHDLRFEGRLDDDGMLCAALAFRQVGEYTLAAYAPGAEEPCFARRFFAAPPDLLRLTPWKGDLHIHTDASDGTEPGLVMARRACELGMDFIAITDHDQHAPSLRAIAEVARTGLPLLVLPGEEVAIREVGGHILSLGARDGVGPLRYREAMDAERDAVRRDVVGDRPLASPLTAEGYAHAAWTVEKIRAFGGMAVIAHPFWEGSPGRYFPPPAVVRQLLSDGLCDGIELMGGSSRVDGNCLAMCLYAETLPRRRLPITGGSDAHALANLGWFWTVALAEELSVAGVLDALRDHRTVACHLRTERDVTILGPLPLVEYAYFLQREFFPTHDIIRRRQAEACAAEDAEAAARHADELAALYEAFWLRV